MKESELMQYVKPSLLRGSTKTYDGLKLHFVMGRSVIDAAKEAGIHRATLGNEVVRTWKRMEKDGYKKIAKRTVLYYLPE